MTRTARFPLQGITLLAVLACCLSSGCQSLTKIRDKGYNTVRSFLTDSYYDPDAERKMAEAEQLYNSGEHKRAQSIFADLANNTQNPTLVAEKARFFEAECLRQRGKLPDAASTYNRLLQDFQTGVYREPATVEMYKIAKGWLESETLKEIEAEATGKAVPWYQKKPPMPNLFDSSRPLFDTEGEALKTLENVTADPFAPNTDKALYLLGHVHFYRGRFEDADLFYSQLVEFHKDSPLMTDALKRAVTAKQLSTGGAVYDTAKAAEALQLVHYAEASNPLFRQNKEENDWIIRAKLGVRLQLAQKDFEMAKYYERTGHPQSAYFYYHLVCRRYPGTKVADLAKERLKVLDVKRAEEEAKKADPSQRSTWDSVKGTWDKMLGRAPAEEGKSSDPDPNKPVTGPQGPPPPQPLGADITNPR
jgi:TolA-binding protein